MRRRRVNMLAFLAPAVAAGIIGGGWILESLPVARGVSAPVAPSARSDPSGDKSVDFADYFRTGVHLLQVGRPGDARRMFEKARTVRPTQPEVHVNLGYAHLALGDHAMAEGAFRTALEINPQQVNAYYGWAESLEAMGDLEGALGAMRTFIHLAPVQDDFVRGARSAVWEWSATLERRRQLGDEPDEDARAQTNEVTNRLDEGLELTGLDGDVDRYGTYHGRTVVLNVWATWCPPCRAELPSLQSLQEQLGEDRFAVVGLSIDKDGDFVREFLRETGVEYRNYLDSAQALAGRMLEVRSYPQTLLIRPDGMIAERIVGARDWIRPEMIARIRAIAADASVAKERRLNSGIGQ